MPIFQNLQKKIKFRREDKILSSDDFENFKNLTFPEIFKNYYLGSYYNIFDFAENFENSRKMTKFSKFSKLSEDKKNLLDGFSIFFEDSEKLTCRL